MPFTVIKGEYVPSAGRPDGDSIRFRPDNPDLVFHLRQRGRPPKINQNNGTIQLRFEGIDTLEKRAISQFSQSATEKNLELCGVPDGTGTAKGAIMSNQLGPNGRPIAFVFSGDVPEDDGQEIFLDGNRLQESVNYKLAEVGETYPLYYDTLFADLREVLTGAIKSARDSGIGLWAADATNTGVQWNGEPSLSSMSPFFPKIWRRLDNYARNREVENPTTLDEFAEFLQHNNNDRVIVIPEGRATGLDNVLEIASDYLKMKHLPEELMIVS